MRPSLSFPAERTLLAGVDEDTAKPAAPGSPSVMRVNFMGLVGPVRRCRFTTQNWLSERAPVCAIVRCAIFSISFNHRAISLFYRAWEKYRFAVAFERGEE